MCFLLILQKRKLYFQSLNLVDINLKLRFLIKRGYYNVSNPSIALVITTVSNYFFPGCLWHLLIFLFDYDYTLEEGGVEAEEEASKQLVNMSISSLCFFMFIQVFFFFQILIWQNNIQIWNFLKIVWHFCGNSWYFSNCFWHNTMDAFGDFFPKSIWDKLQQVTSQKNQDTIVITTLRIGIIKMLLLFLTFYSLEPKIEIRT